MCIQYDLLSNIYKYFKLFTPLFINYKIDRNIFRFCDNELLKDFEYPELQMFMLCVISICFLIKWSQKSTCTFINKYPQFFTVNVKEVITIMTFNMIYFLKIKLYKNSTIIRKFTGPAIYFWWNIRWYCYKFPWISLC